MKATVEVSQFIIVEVPDTLLTEEFMEEYRKYFYNYYTPEDHLKHLAELHAMGAVDNYSFIEGYGRASELGITFEREGGGSELAHLV